MYDCRLVLNRVIHTAIEKETQHEEFGICNPRPYDWLPLVLPIQSVPDHRD